MIMKVKLGDKGQIVIPKVVRESLGLRKNSTAILEVKEKRIEIRRFPEEDFVKDAAERAKRSGGDVSKWVYGDRLYEEEFK
ncbi:AbrB/MazE/SpoVT family DNA-binding domain-containing protein [Candidatus Woesearchaeota archaeon]|nr:AbrB/MazE/SpoVT family DNA-binding domain-containing protein [Candidatus Woesearchaeota archaeon]